MKVRWALLLVVCCVAAGARIVLAALNKPGREVVSEPEPHGVTHEPDMPSTPNVGPVVSPGASGAPPVDALATAKLRADAWYRYVTQVRSSEHWQAVFEEYRKADRVSVFRSEHDAAEVRPLGQEPSAGSRVEARSGQQAVFEAIQSLGERMSERNTTIPGALVEGRFAVIGWRAGSEFEVSVGLETGGHGLGTADLAQFLVAKAKGSWRNLSKEERSRAREAALRLRRSYEKGRRAIWAALWAASSTGARTEVDLAGLRSDSGHLKLVRVGEDRAIDELAAQLEGLTGRLRGRVDELFQ